MKGIAFRWGVILSVGNGSPKPRFSTSRRKIYPFPGIYFCFRRPAPGFTGDFSYQEFWVGFAEC